MRRENIFKELLQSNARTIEQSNSIISASIKSKANANFAKNLDGQTFWVEFQIVP